MESKPIAVELRNITKSFGSFIANDGINLTVHYGEVHGLLGENGAGKSTLMNILYGMLRPDNGEIIVNGGPRAIRGPNDAMTMGIQMVHQHFMLAMPYRAWENVVLGEEPRIGGIFLNKTRAFEEFRRAADMCNFHIDPTETVEQMPVAVRQKLEIVRALYRNCNILILDEPTAVLSVQESDELLNIMDKLRAQGKAIILITHKLREAMQICDTITVLRRGRVVESKPVSEVTPASLAVAMVGRPVLFNLPARQSVQKAVGLELEDVSTGGKKSDLKKVHLHIQKGEILGVAGVEGNGQAALVQTILGLRKPTQGYLRLNGENITNLSTNKRTSRIAHIAEDRHAQGYIGSFSIMENVLLGRQDEAAFHHGALTNRRALEKETSEIVDKFDVRVGTFSESAGALSGGNQQKLLVGREFSKPDAELVIAEYPCRGLDIASSEYIQRSLIDMRNSGKSILLITADLDELLSVSDRVAVMYEGRIVASGKPTEFPPQRLGLLMTGGNV